MIRYTDWPHKAKPNVDAGQELVVYAVLYGVFYREVDIYFFYVCVFQVLSYHASAAEEETRELQVTAVN